MSRVSSQKRLPRPERTATARTRRAGRTYWRLDRHHPEDRGAWVQITDPTERRRAAAEHWGTRTTLAAALVSAALWAAAAIAGTLHEAAAIPLAFAGDAAMGAAVLAGLLGYSLSRPEPTVPTPDPMEHWRGYRPDAVDEIARRLQATP